MHTEADLLPPPPLALWWVCLVCGLHSALDPVPSVVRFFLVRGRLINPPALQDTLQ